MIFYIKKEVSLIAQSGDGKISISSAQYFNRIYYLTYILFYFSNYIRSSCRWINYEKLKH